MTKPHTFHIPVMGSGFTIDTSLKVSQYGIDSALSLVDDVLMEKMRRQYCLKYGLPYDEITDKNPDRRAERITAYLNLLEVIAEKNFNETRETLINNPEKARKYFGMFPENSLLKKGADQMLEKGSFSASAFRKWIYENLQRGSIDVNIMTKLDRQNYRNDEVLPNEYKDAHAAVRGFARSNLDSSLVFSAGLYPELFGYLAEFSDFFPDKNGNLKKKIVIKVSDYRSALIQGKFLAKKGIWVSEFRIESGLNCGGHAFITDGYLLGPILEEFKDKRDELIWTMKEIFIPALKEAGRHVPEKDIPVRISAQGGVGTAEEHGFLLSYYKLDSVGWATPFLLVPETTNVDDHTLKLLSDACEEDVYLSSTSPLEIPYYTLKGNTRDIEKNKRIESGFPGTKCPRKYLALNKEFSERGLCMASSEYQSHKLKQLDEKDITPEEYRAEFNKITEKTCICVGLGTATLINNNIDSSDEGPGVAVCPSPNIAYFSRTVTLKEMVDHIYGKINLIEKERPVVFIKELFICIEFLKGMISENRKSSSKKQLKYLSTYAGNVSAGLEYYFTFFEKIQAFQSTRTSIMQSLVDARRVLNELNEEVKKITGCLNE